MEGLRYFGIIPARFGSTRFPGKPLADLGGKSMLQRVFGQVSQVKRLSGLAVATDDNRILGHVRDFGGVAIMTSASHSSGTSRCAEAAAKLFPSLRQDDVIVNIQGDEPFILPAQIDALLDVFADAGTGIATLATPLKQAESLRDPHIVKVICDSKKRALYFSRQAIPFVRDEAEDQWTAHFPYLKHIGIYAYRYAELQEITRLPPGRLEKAEQLEQLRWMEAGYTIRVAETAQDTMSIDTPEDLVNALRRFGEDLP